MALSDAGLVANAKAQILNLLTTFNKSTPRDTHYLQNRLLEVCDNLKLALNPDPVTLNSWVAEINEALPSTIHYSEIDGLIELVLDQIIKVPITYKSSPVSLFGFSNYDDISSKSTIVHFPGGSSASNSDEVIVTADEKENTHNYYRPVLGVFTKDNSGDHQTYLKFFNINGIPNGTFYFTDPVKTQEVKQDFFPTSTSASALTFDFKEASINGSKTVPAGGFPGLAGGDSYKTVNAGSTSKVNFYTAVRYLSKWKALDALRRFDVLYQTKYNAPGNISIDTHLIWYISSGDLNRTDHVNDELCLWIWMAPKEIKRQYPQIPTLLGLPPRRNIENGTGKIALGHNIIKSKFIAGEQFYIKESGDTAELYVLTNTPNPNLPTQIDQVLKRSSGGADSSSPLAEQASNILSIFNFRYYRRVDRATATVIKWLPSANRPNSSADGTDITAPSPPLPTGYTGAIAINNPISFNLSQNLLFFKEYTQSGAPAGISLKNKGNDLFRTRGKRLAAGGVMAKLRNYISSSPKPGSDSSLSASDMSAWEMTQSDKAREAWKEIKQSNRDTLPINQEWCHLLGHGDGGDERLGNFVSGSFHCNTEQLAMESKDRRKVTQGARKGTYTLRSTAYLFNDGENLLNGNYLTNDKAYNQMQRVYASLKKPSTQPAVVNKTGTVLPFAAFLRYKMYVNPSVGDAAGAPTRASFQKLFDYIFEGQSEFIDQHQFAIIKYTSWFCLAGEDAFKAWYVEQTATAVAGDAAE